MYGALALACNQTFVTFFSEEKLMEKAELVDVFSQRRIAYPSASMSQNLVTTGWNEKKNRHLFHDVVFEVTLENLILKIYNTRSF